MKQKRLVLLAGDIITLWVGLLITLLIRYGMGGLFDRILALHIAPFSIIFAVWVLIFYIMGLYEIRRINEIPAAIKLLIYGMAIGGGIAISFFYFIRYFIITPRINLIFDIFITTTLLIGWRLFFIARAGTISKTRVLLVGSSPDIEELDQAIKKYPQLSYSVVARANNLGEILDLLKQERIDIVVAPKEIESQEKFVQAIYETLHRGIRFIDAAAFYENILGKIPVSFISKTWFLENIAETEKRTFELIKRGLDIFFSLFLGILSLPFLPLIALFIKTSSAGPVFLKQKRVGRMGSIYTHYKYRTMVALGPDGHAEPNGAEWTRCEDIRITRVGRFLRKTRIDELPQLWNILKGELSFIGPRPERPEFVEELRKEIPFYDMRHIIRPGLSGWAQINPPFYYGTHKEAVLKMQYDLYYIKNRDFGLDLDIALKTLMVILTASGR